MKDLTYGTYRGKHWFIRWTTPWAYPYTLQPLRVVREILLTLIGWRFWHQIELRLRTQPKYQSRCYCLAGSLTEFRFQAAGFLLWVALSRFTGTVPCPCDVGLHEYHVSQGEDCGCIVADSEL